MEMHQGALYIPPISHYTRIYKQKYLLDVTKVKREVPYQKLDNNRGLCKDAYCKAIPKLLTWCTGYNGSSQSSPKDQDSYQPQISSHQ